MLLALLSFPAATHAAEVRGITVPPRIRPSPLDELTADGRPSSAAIDVLRSHARRRVTLVWVGDRRFEARGVRIDSLGVTFTGAPASGPTLILWSDIDRLETRHSYVVPGIFAGLFATTAVLGTLSGSGNEWGPAAIVLAIALPPTGMVVGGLIGRSLPLWQHEWPPAARTR